MSFLQRLFGETQQRAALMPLYDALVQIGRDPSWYREGGVPDTLDGRFDMLSAVTAMALLRLEAEGEAGKGPSVLLTEIFIDDMDGTLRQIGIGDYVVGKHIGRMMSALGGRLGAFREAADAGALSEAVRRNIFHEAPPAESSVAFVAGRLDRFASGLERVAMADLLEGKVPRP